MPARIVWLWLLSAVAPAPAQDAPALGPGSTIPLAVAASEGEGNGPRVVTAGELASDSGGAFAISAASDDTDPKLRISSKTRGLIGEDADSGGGTTAFLLAKLEPGARIVVEVVAPPGPEATVEVRVREIVETVETREAAARGRAELAAAKQAIAARSEEDGRTRLETAVEDLLAAEGWRRSREIWTVLDAAGAAAHRAGAGKVARRAFRAAVRVADDLYPPTHPERLAARVNLAAVVMDDDPAASRAAFEEILAIREKTLPQDHVDLFRTRANLAEACVGIGDFATARDLHARALAGILLKRPDTDPLVIQERLVLGRTERALGNVEAARALSEKAYADASAAFAEDDELRLFALNELAENRSADRDFRGAAELQRLVLAARLRKLPDDHLDVQFARATLAGSLRELGELEEARVLIERAHREFARRLPADHLQIQTVRANLALVLRSLGDFAAARDIQETVHDALAARHPEEHPDLVKVRRNLANTLVDAGDHAAALKLRRQVLDTLARTKPDADPSVQTARSDVARVLIELGDLDAAQALLETAERHLRDNPAAFPFQHLGVRLDLAHVHHRRGDAETARRIQEELLSQAVAKEGPRGTHAQIITQNLALALSQLGDHLGARRLQEQVLAARLAALGPVAAEVQEARLGLATTLCWLGDADAAHDLLVAAVEVCSRTLPESSALLQKARGNLAATYRFRGDHESARKLLARALEAQVKSLGDGNATVQITRGNLAGVLEEMGRFEEASALHEEALKHRRAALGEDHPETLVGRVTLGGCLRRMGRTEEARDLLEAAVAKLAATRPETDHLLQTGRSELAWALVAEEKWDAAAENLWRLAYGLDMRLWMNAAGLSPREVSALVDDLNPLLSSALSLEAVPEVGASGGRPASRLSSLVEPFRGATLAASHAAREALASGSLAEVEAARRRITALAMRSADLARRGDIEGALDAVRRKEGVERDLRDRHPRRFAGGASVIALVPGGLAEDEAIVGYWRYVRTEKEGAGDGRRADVPSFTAFVARGGRVMRLELGPAAAIEDAVAFFRDAVLAPDGADPQASAALEERAGAALRALVWDPLAGALAGCRKAIVLPDDVLHLVPIGALPLGGGRVVADAVRVHLRCSLDSLHADPPGGGALVALGGVDYDAEGKAPEAGGGDPAAAGSGADAVVLRSGPEGRAFPPLPGSDAEARAVVDLHTEAFPDAARPAHLSGASASRAAFVRAAPGARFLHLATHAWISGAHPSMPQDPRPVDAISGAGSFPSAEARMRGLAPMLLTGLALAGANRPPDASGNVGGALTAEEIAGLDLRRCELAVLSACETGVSVRRAGRGLASLQQALHAAGAREAVTSLWKVPDEATRRLMEAFYRGLWKGGLDPPTALEAAQSLLRRERDADGRPAHRMRAWAAWVLTRSG